MKFTTSGSELQKALSKVGGVVPSKSTMPILENILFDLQGNTLTMTATDLELSMTLSLDVRGSEDGKTAVPAKRLTDTIRALPDLPVTFDIDTTLNKIRITTETGEYGLTGEGATEFPTIAPFKSSEEMMFEGAALKRLIHRTTFAVSSDELRPAMMGVLMQPEGKELRCAATDGHRLVKTTTNFSQDLPLKKKFIVPAKALNILSKLVDGGSVTVGVSETHVKFGFDSTILISRVIDETYPNYESVIPLENDKMLTVNRERMIQGIRRVSLYASASTHQVRLSMSKDSLKISAQDIDFGGEAKEQLECEYGSDDLEVGFNATYLLDVLTHLDSEEVSFRFSTSTRAGIVVPAGTKDKTEDVLMLVMPVRLNN